MILSRLTTVLLGMSPRERWLLAGLFGLAVPVAVAFLWILPLTDTRTQARADLRAAQNLQIWVNTMATQDAALRGRTPATQADPPVAIGVSGIEESLKNAGLRPVVTQLSRRDGGAVTLQLEPVDFLELTQWLDATEPNWGYRIASFRFERTDRAGLVFAEFQLELAQ